MDVKHVMAHQSSHGDMMAPTAIDTPKRHSSQQHFCRVEGQLLRSPGRRTTNVSITNRHARQKQAREMKQTVASAWAC